MSIIAARTEILPFDEWVAEKGGDVRRIADLTVRFLDTVTTATGQATAYNTKQTQETAMEAIHKAMFEMDRGLYALLVSADGVLDISRQAAACMLLDNPRIGGGRCGSLLDSAQEGMLLTNLVNALPDSRKMKLFVKFRGVNNSRTRKLIMRCLLAQPIDRIEDWAVRYRSKMRAALEHALGKEYAGAIRKIAKSTTKVGSLDLKTIEFLRKRLFKFHSDHGVNACSSILQCVGFALGAERSDFTMSRLKAFMAVKGGNFEAGNVLPKEVLEGLRARYHNGVPHAKVIEMTEKNLTRNQRAQVQREAKQAGVEVAFDPDTMDAVKLYVYAMEMGMDGAIAAALRRKAEKAASMLPGTLGNTAIVYDTSGSMYGRREQKLRAHAIGLAVRDMIVAASTSCSIFPSGGDACDKAIWHVGGRTALALPIAEALRSNAKRVFVITDGYENSPAGRSAEVLKAARRLGCMKPVYQLTPVMSAEAAGVKELAPGLTHTMPVSSPSMLAVSYIRAALSQDPVEGLRMLVEQTACAVLSDTRKRKKTIEAEQLAMIESK
jgi:hypothetical protein